MRRRAAGLSRARCHESVARLVCRRRSRQSAGESSRCPRYPRDRLCQWDDLRAALAIFLIVVAATFPVVLPFAFSSDVGTAKTVSARALSRHAVFRRARSRALRGLRELESRVHDGWAGYRTCDRDQRARRMKAALRSFAALAVVVATSASAQEYFGSGRRALPLPARNRRGNSRSPRIPPSFAAARTTRRRSR